VENKISRNTSIEKFCLFVWIVKSPQRHVDREILFVRVDSKESLTLDTSIDKFFVFVWIVKSLKNFDRELLCVFVWMVKRPVRVL
jgi:hypothetical protein